ncbi:TetR/AcrR family transcriptional regulator [Actinoplanes sp. NPDC051494]|uniref:TetR/AcrR family transcriptional regulator n=1 Tax=Actinoplanes sp. NPDC051494 TaxID=3363907 RepID=UPI00378DF92F
MPVPRGTSLDPARTRDGILAAATGLLYERGLDAVGVAELCAAVGASKETLYRHFGSKDGLIEAALTARSDRVMTWVSTAVEAAGDDPVAALEAVFDALGEWYTRPEFRGCAIVNAATQRRAGPVGDFSAWHLDRWLALLADIARRGGAADPARLARQLLILVEGATVVADHHRAGALAAADAKATALTLLAAR